MLNVPISEKQKLENALRIIDQLLNRHCDNMIAKRIGQNFGDDYQRACEFIVTLLNTMQPSTQERNLNFRPTR